MAYLEVVFNLPLNTVFTYEAPEGREIGVGTRVQAPFGRRSLLGFVIGLTEKRPDFALKRVERAIDFEPLFGEAEIDLARWMAGMYLCGLGEALATILPGGRREKEAPALDAEEIAPAVDHELSDEQRVAVDGICGEESGYSYLFGITGSGKTEVFLAAASKTLDEGRGVIYLVPEISLTRQTEEAIRSRFGQGTAILHSRLTPSQRLAEWSRIRKGEARLVVGARSAVFAPANPLGLVILDEEHEGSYKSGTTPRYHARQVAMYRCAKAKARLIMGSATPSLEAFHLMNGEKPRIAKYTLSKRLSGGIMPEIEVVDMKREASALSGVLVKEMREVAREGRQIILFLNRRGFSYFFHCRSCGYEMMCKHCSVPLTYHRDRGLMLCHYCGSTAKPEKVCPSCGSLDIGYSGFGTELVEEEVGKLFPDLSVGRLDTDSVRKTKGPASVLEEFRKGRLQVLLGTQMVAKGLNFPGVKLVGIVLADTGLSLPDFRASERAFSLVVQVAGRAGRFSPDGRVVIQTFRPDSDAIRMAAAHDVEGFYRRETEIRRALSFPPFTRLVRIVYRGRDSGKVDACANKDAALLEPRISGSAELLGPAECAIACIAGNHRIHILLKTRDFSKTHAALSSAWRDLEPNAQVYREIDIDPVNLL